MKERPRFILAVYLIVNEKGKTLLYLRQNTGYCDGMYSLVAGHVEENESVIDAMIREAKEEADMDLIPDDLEGVLTMHRKERVDFFFKLKKFSGKFKNLEPDKCKELKFFDINELPKNTIPYISKALRTSKSILEFEFKD